MPKVSVIVPAYNVEKYVEKCLESLINQTLDSMEIIVVNDGSKDKTKQKILQFCQKYPDKIKYLEKENGGLSSARNFGMPYATGEYIAFLDSDDYVEKNMYKEMYEEAKRNDCDMVECDFLWEYPNKIKEDHGTLVQNKKELIAKNRVVAWNKLIKRETLENAKIEFPIGLRYEDVEFFYKLVPYLNKVSLVNKCFIHYVQRENSIVNTQNSRTKEIFDVLDNVIKYYKEKELFDEYKKELEYIYTRFLLCSSLKRMLKIEDKKERRNALRQTWENLNKNFPNWEKNRILKEDRSLKNTYINVIGILKRFNLIKIRNNEEGVKYKERKKIDGNFAQHLIGLFIILSPILDITSFIFRKKFNTNWSPATILRPIIPCLIFIYLFLKQNKKKRIILISSLYCIYAIIHMFIFKKLWTQSAYGGMVNELQYVVNYTFMILVLYVFYEVFKEKDVKILKRSIMYSILIYVCSIFIAILTKTSSSTYIEGIGYKGWFESGNSLCATICISLCIILTINKNNKIALSAIITFIISAIYLVIFSGTRTGVLGVIIVGATYIITMASRLIYNKGKISKKRVLIALAIFCMVILIIVISGMQVLKRRQELKENEYMNVDPDTGIVRNVSGDILSLYKQIQNGEITEQYMTKETQKSICELYDYAKRTHLSNVNLRKQQLIYNLFLVKNQKSILLVLFGNGYKTQFRELVMEMEVPAIICNFGLVGFMLYLGPFIFIWVYKLYKLVKNKKFEQEKIMHITGLSLGLVLSTLAGYTFFNQSSMIIMCSICILVLNRDNKLNIRTNIGR